jgi:hypothetical protein
MRHLGSNRASPKFTFGRYFLLFGRLPARARSETAISFVSGRFRVESRRATICSALTLAHRIASQLASCLGALSIVRNTLLRKRTITVMAHSCLFCDANGAGVLTNEHVVPQWLLRHLDLPADDMLFQGVASSATEALVEAPRIHSSFNFVQGQICEECNTGWMSRLEGVAKPILVPLIENERVIQSLLPEEAEIVGKWAVKTAYMHSWTSPLKRPVQLDHLKALLGDDGRPFLGVGVFGMQSDFDKQTAYLQRRSPTLRWNPRRGLQSRPPISPLVSADRLLAKSDVRPDAGKGSPYSDNSNRAGWIAILFNRINRT